MTAPAYDTYRDSGIDWLGKVPSHWGVSPLKTPYAIFGGATPKSEREDYWDGGVPWVTPADLSRLTSPFIGETLRTISETGLASCAASLVPADSVILSTRAPIGSIGITTASATTNQGCKALVSRGGAVSSFLAYTLSIATEQLRVRGKGTTFLELSGDELGRFKVPTPPSAEQAAIAAFLDRETGKIDALVEAQTRLIELLKEKRQAVISHAVTKGLDPAVPMKDSGVEWLGQVPAHWEICRLKDLTVPGDGVQMGPFGGMLKDLLGEPGEFKVYGQENVTNCDFERGRRWIDEERFQELSNYALRVGDLMLTRKGSVGNCFMFSAEAQPGIIDSDTIRIRLSTERIATRFALTILHDADYVAKQIDLTKRGAILAGLNTGVVSNLIIYLPPLAEQVEILKAVETSTRRIDQLQMEAETAIALLQERRSVLISAAVTGKIDVRGLAREQAEAA